MRKIKQSIPVGKLALNEGQIDWLPRNPRQWTKDDIERMVKSLDEDPDFMEDRPPLVTPQENGRFCVFAGNERTDAEKKRSKRKEIDVIVYYPESDEDRETIIRRAIKDNGHFGSWDYDTLANEWDVPFEDWGVPVEDVEKTIKKLKKEEEKLGLVPFTEVLGEEHNYIVLFFDNEVDWLQAQTLFDITPVKALPTRRGGTQSLAFQKRIGVGRVINGAKAINKLLDNKGEGQ